MQTDFEYQQKLEQARRKVKSIRGFYTHFSVYIIVNALLLTLKAFSLKPDEDYFTFGNFNMAIFWGLGVGFHALGVFGTNIFMGSNWEDRKIKELMEKQNRSTKWE